MTTKLEQLARIITEQESVVTQQLLIQGQEIQKLTELINNSRTRVKANLYKKKRKKVRAIVEQLIANHDRTTKATASLKAQYEANDD